MTDTDIKTLIERLRKMAEPDYYGPVHFVSPEESADALEALQDELKQALADKDRFFRQMRDNARDRIEAP